METKSDSERVRSIAHRDISTRVAVRTQTQDKLQETNYFRRQMKDSGGTVTISDGT
jgi:hypothetical protein